MAMTQMLMAGAESGEAVDSDGYPTLNMIFKVDPGNSSSYSSGNTGVNDISGGTAYNGHLMNDQNATYGGPTWGSGNGGHWSLDGNDDWIRFDSLSSALHNGNDKTFLFWGNCTWRNQSGRGDVMWSSHQGTSNTLRWQAMTNQVFVSDMNTTGDIFHAHQNLGNEWHMWVMTVDSSGGAGSIVNWVDNVKNSNTGTFGQWNSNTDRVNIGQEWDSTPSEFYRGQIGAILLWDRILPDGTINNIWSSTKSRYGR